MITLDSFRNSSTFIDIYNKLNISKLYNLKKQKIHKICNKLIKNMQENSCNWVHRNTIYIDKVKRSEQKNYKPLLNSNS